MTPARRLIASVGPRHNRLRPPAVEAQAPRGRAPSDRRSVLLNLTATGVGLIDRLAAEHLEEMLRQEPLLAKSLRKLRSMGADRGVTADRS